MIEERAPPAERAVGDDVDVTESHHAERDTRIEIGERHAAAANVLAAPWQIVGEDDVLDGVAETVEDPVVVPVVVQVAQASFNVASR